MIQLILAISLWKDSTTHMCGLAVYVKEGLPFAWDLFLENSVDSYFLPFTGKFWSCCCLSFHWLSIKFKRKSPFRRIAYDYSSADADWDRLCNHLRDVPWEDIFKLGAYAAPCEFCQWVQVAINVLAKLLGSHRLSFISICKFGSFKNPFALITSLSELSFRFRRFILLVQSRKKID